MGIGIWIVSAAASAAVAQIIPAGRDGRWVLETVLAIMAGFVAGVAATALDFGGWNEIDGRAALLTGLTGFLAVGVSRLIRMRR